MSIHFPVLLTDRLPALSDQVFVGPEEYVDGQVRRFARNRNSSRYFRLGRKEYFLLAHLDGKSTPEETIRNYAQQFRRRLTLEALNDALRTMVNSGLVMAPIDGVNAAGTAVPEQTVEPVENVSVITQMPSLLSFTVFSLKPDKLLDRIVPWLSWIVHGNVVMTWLGMIVIFEAVLAFHLTEVVRTTINASRDTLPVRIMILYAVLIVTTVLHEAGHAIACRACKGEVREVGVMFKYLTFRAYSKLDDILLFTSRLHRCYVLLLGPLVSLSLIPIAYVTWLYVAPGGFLRVVLADILVWYNVACLIQFIPYLKLDGYFILAQLLRMPDLMRDSYVFLFRKLMPKFISRRTMNVSSDCPSYVRVVYVVYGISSIIMTGLVMYYTINGYFKRLSDWIGRDAGHAIIAVILIIVALRFSWRMWRWNNEEK